MPIAIAAIAPENDARSESQPYRKPTESPYAARR
jgi:hypothetical protein